MENLSQIDVKSHLHPFTLISEHRDPGRIVSHANGIRIHDQNGRTYLDAMSGLWCVNIGYGSHQMTDAIQQASRTVSFAHTMFGASNEYATRLADRLIRLCPGNNAMRKVFFGHSDSNANDTALKLARLYFLASGQPMRTKFISCWDSYHSTTFATASLSGLPGHHRNFALPDPSFLHVSAPDVFDALSRRGFSSESDYVDFLVKEMEDTISATGGGDKVAAFSSNLSWPLAVFSLRH
jgi:adenosylmethionine-8-amino-7-oxononanoate aminotransferase